MVSLFVIILITMKATVVPYFLSSQDKQHEVFRICSCLAKPIDWKGVGKPKVVRPIFPTISNIKEKQFSFCLISKDKLILKLFLDC